MRFVDVLPGENEAIAADSMRHFRSRVLHVVDFDYASFMSFGARSWPAYVLANAEGQVVAQLVGLGRGVGAEARWRIALEEVSGGSTAPPAASGFETVCEDGICRLVPPDGEEPPVRETEPAAAAGREGGIWIAWVSDREGDNNVYLRRQVGAKVGEEIPVTSSLADDYAPALAVAPDGRVWVAWTSNRAGKYDVYLRGYDGKRWSKEIRVTESADDAMRPSVAVDGAGRVWVTYYRWNRDFGTSRDRDVFARWFRGDEASDELRVSPAEPAIEDHADPVVIADPSLSGRVWIAWSWDYHPSIQEGTPLDTDQPSIFAAPVDADGGVGAPLHVGTPGVSQHAVDLWPSLAFDAEGVLWCAYDVASLTRRRRGALISRLDGDAFAIPDRVVLTDAEFSYPTLAVDGDGAKVLAWTQRVDGVWQVHAVRDDGSGWSQPLVVNPAPDDQRAPAMVTDTNGTWIVYVEREGFGSRVRTVRLVWPEGR